MSAPTVHTQRFILTSAGELLNVDYIVRLRIVSGKLIADMASGPDIEVFADLSQMDDLRRYLSFNARA